MFKRSNYNTTIHFQNTFITYNSISDCFFEYKENEASIVEEIINSPNNTNLSPEYLKIRDSLISNGILINEEIDELSVLERKYYKWNNESEMLLTIALTPNCNFNCRYCFEDHSHKGEFNHDIENKIISFIAKNTKKNKRLMIDWYGGEPLLKYDLLCGLDKQISDISKKNGCDYSSSISTNGYLLKKDAVDNLIENTSVRSLRICLDGPPEIHDNYRPHKNGGGTFNTIIENIKYAVKHIKIKLRINLDKNNYQYIYKLIYILKKSGLQGSNLVISVKPIVSSRIRPREDISFTLEEYSTVEPTVKSYFIQEKLNFDVQKVNCAYCAVYHKNQYMIDWRGLIYKCTDTFNPDESIGLISDFGEVELNKDEWNKWTSYPGTVYDECRNCTVLPLCMGGCSFNRHIANKEFCSSIKYNLNKYIELYYLNRKGEEHFGN
ncbi:MAG TPA: hypothetical protein DEG71_03860 [Clostridiales bacterium]|nr:hypothetical protein [Clostridiales bacterium]